MYYCGARDADGYFQVGLALSADGQNWVKYPENPIVKFGGNPAGIYTLDVLRDADGYTLFVSQPNAAREFEMFALRSVERVDVDFGGRADGPRPLARRDLGRPDGLRDGGDGAGRTGLFVVQRDLRPERAEGGRGGAGEDWEGELRRLFGGM